MHKAKLSLEERQSKSAEIKKKYPTFTPVICEKYPGENNPTIEKQKFLVPGDLIVQQFISVAQKKNNIGFSEGLVFYLNEGDKIAPENALISELYKLHKDEDGFLYLYMGHRVDKLRIEKGKDQRKFSVISILLKILKQYPASFDGITPMKTIDLKNDLKKALNGKTWESEYQEDFGTLEIFLSLHGDNFIVEPVTQQVGLAHKPQNLMFSNGDSEASLYSSNSAWITFVLVTSLTQGEGLNGVALVTENSTSQVDYQAEVQNFTDTKSTTLIEHLLEVGANANSVVKIKECCYDFTEGMTALQLGILLCREDPSQGLLAVRALLKHGANPNHQINQLRIGEHEELGSSAEGMTSLHLAISLFEEGKFECLELVTMLLEHNADPNSPMTLTTFGDDSHKQFTPLLLAIFRWGLDVGLKTDKEQQNRFWLALIKMLLQRNANPNWSSLTATALEMTLFPSLHNPSYGLQIIQALLENGFDPNKSKHSNKESHGEAALMWVWKLSKSFDEKRKKPAVELFRLLESLLEPTSANHQTTPEVVSIQLCDRVIRGNDWKWGDQDGGAGKRGTVVSVEKLEDWIWWDQNCEAVGKENTVKCPEEFYWCEVEWDSGGKNWYRCGWRGKNDLVVAPNLLNESLSVVDEYFK